MHPRATTATLNIPDVEGSSATNLKNQHFMKKVKKNGATTMSKTTLSVLTFSTLLNKPEHSA
jgi:hypothetical protein